MKVTPTLVLALVGLAVAAAPACKGETAEDAKAEATKGTGNDAAPTAETTARPKGGAPTAAGAEIGVPECDAFIEKYARCIAEKVPEAGRAGAQTAMEAMIKGFEDAANGPGRDQLAATCKASEDTTKQSMSAMGCTW